MKPNTRLLIRFTLPNGDLKGWGYDYPFYNNENVLRTEIQNDFSDFPENTAIHLFYFDQETTVEASSSHELSEQTINWLISTGEYNGN